MPTAAATTVERRIQAASDDAEESARRKASSHSDDLELVDDGTSQHVGLRFRRLTIPRRARITRAYVQFEADERQREPTRLLVEGEAADDAATFTSASGDISDRPRTARSVSWSPRPWQRIGADGPDQRTPDLSALLQEIVDRPGWRSGNAVALILSGAGRRTARAYDGLQAGAPLLHVELTARTTRAPARRPFPHRYLFGSGDDPAAAKSVGFNLIDVGSKWHADALPDGARALLYLGTGAAWDDATCRWDLSDATVASTVSATANDPKVAGYFFSDEPDPARCPNAVAAHRARVALIRSLAPTKFTLMVIDSNSGQATLSQIPQWVGVADYAGLDVYPCYQGRACDFGWQRQVIAAADAVGLSYFGGAQAFRDASEWRWPTAAELQTQLDIWAASKAKGYMLFAWTWAGYDLASRSGLLKVLRQFNLKG